MGFGKNLLAVLLAGVGGGAKAFGDEKLREYERERENAQKLQFLRDSQPIEVETYKQKSAIASAIDPATGEVDPERLRAIAAIANARRKSPSGGVGGSGGGAPQWRTPAGGGRVPRWNPVTKTRE